MTKYFLDTNVFDFIIDNNIDIVALQLRGTFYTSNIQESEIKNTKNIDKLNKLLKAYNSLKQEKLLLSSGIWLDDLYWDDEQPWVDEIGEIAIKLIGNTKKKPWKDALMGEIAKLNNLVLVTNDDKLLKRASLHNIKAITTRQFIGATEA